MKVNELCKRIGKSRYYIAQLPEGTSANNIINIAHAIGCNTSELFKGL